MKQLTFLSYNNYNNRQVKYGRSYVDYHGPALDPYPYFQNFYQYNFKYGNGVDTQVVVNTRLNEYVNLDWTPDYVVVFDNDTAAPCDDTEPAESRWFVMEWYKNREEQYVAVLKRDVIADNYEAILEAPAFIEKGYVNDSENPLLYNSENNAFNQIKKSEKLIKDETGIAWVVGYIPRDAFTEATTIRGTSYSDIAANIEVADITLWGPYAYQNNPYQGYLQLDWIKTNYSNRLTEYISTYVNTSRKLYGDASYGAEEFGQRTTSARALYKDNNGANIYQGITKALVNTWAGYLNSEHHGPNDNSYQRELQALNGQIIKDTSTNIAYRIQIVEEDTGMETTLYNQNVRTELTAKVDDYLSGTPDNTSFEYKYTIPKFRVVLQQIATNIYMSIPASANRLHLTDAPYDMFCIPYGELTIYRTGGADPIVTSKEVAIDIAQAIQAQAGSGNLYDLQLLPYCPARYCINDSGMFNLPVATNRFSLITDGVSYEDVSVAIWCSESTLEFKIWESNLFLSDLTPKSLKIDNETKVYRLCDPSYNNYFDFSLSKNGGFVNCWNIDCTYKPYSPYIHVAPDFHFMYGQDFDDCRGLICGGDFSLPQITSAWADYQLQNKNYNEIFKRQIQNLDINRKYQRISEATSGIANALGAGVSGANAGLMAGGGAAAGVAGAVTASVSLAAGIADMYINEKLFEESKSFLTDKFNFELGNIQAIPYGLTKVSAFTANNKIFPFLEIYEASAEEIEALGYQIDYEGMTLRVIGKIRDYIIPGSYIKGRIIRLDPLQVHEDEHTTSSINIELDKGVYFE